MTQTAAPAPVESTCDHRVGIWIGNRISQEDGGVRALIRARAGQFRSGNLTAIVGAGDWAPSQ